jgi:hypothetical protein
MWRLRSDGQMGSLYPLADLRHHGGNRAVRLLTGLALRARLRGGSQPGNARTTENLWRAAAAAELFACGLATEAHRRAVKAPLNRGRPRPTHSPDRPHALNCLVQAACLALRQWGCCNFALELLVSSSRRTPSGPATVAQRVRDADLMRPAVWRYLALAERLAVAAGRRPAWRHPAPRLRALTEACDHGLGALYQRRSFAWRCSDCGHFAERVEPRWQASAT